MDDLAIQEALNRLPLEVVVLDGSGLIVAVNNEWRRFAAANGAPTELINGIGANYLEVCRTGTSKSSPLAMEALSGLQSILNGTIGSFLLEYPCHSTDQQRWFLMKAVPFPPSQGLLITHDDITDRKRRELQLWEAALRDSLTGVLNRRGLAEQRKTIAAAGGKRYPLVVAADIDGLKHINDTLGHAAGDAVIIAAARALSFRRAIVCRLGGDEFQVLLSKKQPRYARKYLQMVKQRFLAGIGDIPAQLSLGFARFPEDGETLEEVAARADEAMYESRRTHDAWAA